MWALKWCWGSLILNTNVIANALGMVAHRVAGSTVSEAAVDSSVQIAMKFNTELMGNLWWWIVVGMTVAMIIECVARKRKIGSNIAVAFAVLMTALYPYIWYSVVVNHSVIHYWFTYRAQIVMVFGLMCISIKITEGKR